MGVQASAGGQRQLWLVQAQAPTPSGAAAQQAGGQAGPGGEPVSLLLTALGGIPDTALLRACADAAAMRASLTQVWQPLQLHRPRCLNCAHGCT